MIFHTSQRKINTIHLKINNTIIEWVTQFVFLGLILNENMSWKDHINKISNKISQSLGILNKLKHILPINAKILIYSSLILSHLTFGILAWSRNCERITILKKKCIRTITSSKYNAHTEPIFKELNLLKVEDIFELQVLKFYFKFKNGSLPHCLQSLPLQHNQDIHNHNTHTIKSENSPIKNKSWICQTMYPK